MPRIFPPLPPHSCQFFVAHPTYQHTESNRKSQATVTVLITIPFKSLFGNIAASMLAPDTLEYKFVVYKDIICHYSPFFHAAFNGNFEEGRTQTINFVDVDHEIFDLLLKWIYTKDIKNVMDQRPSLMSCAKLWMLGDRFLMPEMQNHAMDQIHKILVTTIGIGVDGFGEFCRLAVEMKIEDNPLARIAVSMLCWSKTVYARWIDEIPQPILGLVLKALNIPHKHSSRYSLPKEAYWISDIERFYVKE